MAEGMRVTRRRLAGDWVLYGQDDAPLGRLAYTESGALRFEPRRGEERTFSAPELRAIADELERLEGTHG